MYMGVSLLMQLGVTDASKTRENHYFSRRTKSICPIFCLSVIFFMIDSILAASVSCATEAPAACKRSSTPIQYRSKEALMWRR
jgi:hypothetical protein